MKKKQVLKHSKKHLQKTVSQKHTLSHTLDDSETDRCLFFGKRTCLIFATRLLSKKNHTLSQFAHTNTLQHNTHTESEANLSGDHGGKLWKKYMTYFVKRNVCPSISWNSVQESSYTQVLINIIYCRERWKEGTFLIKNIFDVTQVLKTI